MEIVKIAVMGIVGVLIAIQFKSHKPEYGGYVGIGISILIFYYVVQSLAGVMGQLSAMQKYMEFGQGYIGILLKVMGITYICEFSAGICKDAGHQSVAGQIELLGRLAVMFSGLPIILAVIEQLEEFW